MTPSRPLWRAAAGALALALVLVVAGCGDDGGDDSAEDTTTTTEAEETSTTAAETTDTTESAEPDADAQALAEAVILTEGDFDAGWTAEPPEDDDTEIFDCLSDVDLDRVTDAEVDSDQFSQSDPAGQALISASSTGLVLADEEAATALLEELGSNQFAGCALDQLVGGLEEDGSTVTDSDLTPNDAIYPIGDESVTLNGFFSLEGADGSTAEGDLSLTFVRTGNVVTGFNVFDVGDTEFATVVDQVASVIGGKHQSEVG